MQALEFVSTECLRPGICDRSWASFRKHLKGVDWKESTLYLNIDYTPHCMKREVIPSLVIEAAMGHFGKVEWNVPNEPNFTRAVKWGWSQPQNEYFFYLQADWLLTEDIDIDELKTLLKDPYCAVNLRAHGPQVKERLCLSPVLIKSTIARRLIRDMDDEIGPEAILRDPKMRTGGRSLGVDLKSLHYPPHRPIIRDIGKEWMKRNAVVKKGGNSFVVWR